MIPTYSRRGRIALMAAHCVGMVDLVALPVWVGTLVARYGFDPQQAGMLASQFLFGAVLASVLVAPRFNCLNGRLVVTLGFGAAALGFGVASTTASFGRLAVLHGLCGIAAGAALSVTHGTVARSAQPHQLFALLGMALGVFAILFMSATPGIVASAGGSALFKVFAAVMLTGAVLAALAFPSADLGRGDVAGAQTGATVRAYAPIEPVIRFGISGIACMSLVQAMTFSFLERVGNDRGFGLPAINGVLIALGLVALLPPILAALLEKRLAARTVMLVGPLLQSLLALVILNSSGFMPYAVAACLFAPVLIYTHIFAFGLMARLDPSGTAMAATPAMVMVGAAIGPLVGGTLVKTFGYGSVGTAAFVIAVLAVGAFSCLPRSEPSAAETPGVI